MNVEAASQLPFSSSFCLFFHLFFHFSFHLFLQSSSLWSPKPQTDTKGKVNLLPFSWEKREDGDTFLKRVCAHETLTLPSLFLWKNMCYKLLFLPNSDKQSRRMNEKGRAKTNLSQQNDSPKISLERFKLLWGKESFLLPVLFVWSLSAFSFTSCKRECNRERIFVWIQIFLSIRFTELFICFLTTDTSGLFQVMGE